VSEANELRAADARTGVSISLGAAASRAVVALLIVLGGATSYFWITTPASAPHAPSPVAAAVPVVAGSASIRDMPIWLTGIGTATPLNVVDVKVRVDGQLQSVTFTEGEQVKAGQVLAQIDPRPYQATLAQAVANRQKDLAQLANARQEVIRAGKLASAGAGTSQNLDAMRAQAAALEATIAADEATIDAARLNLEFTRVVSPLAGRVGLRQVDPGSIVHASDSVGLVKITQMAPISVLLALPQDELAALTDPQSGTELPVAVDTRDGAKHIADGRLVFIDSTVDQATGQIQLKALFDNSDRALWPGEFVSARVLARTDQGAIVVPSQAVLMGESGPYVYLLKPDDTVAAQSVTVGPSADGYTEIRRGLAAGQAIVLDGQSRLRPGSHVTVTGNPTPAEGAGS
jgi:membrane fusion protein, multidrug efflux system